MVHRGPSVLVLSDTYLFCHSSPSIPTLQMAVEAAGKSLWAHQRTNHRSITGIGISVFMPITALRTISLWASPKIYYEENNDLLPTIDEELSGQQRIQHKRKVWTEIGWRARWRSGLTPVLLGFQCSFRVLYVHSQFLGTSGTLVPPSNYCKPLFLFPTAQGKWDQTLCGIL